MQVTATQLAQWISDATSGDQATLDNIPEPWADLVRTMIDTGFADFHWWAEAQQSQK